MEIFFFSIRSEFGISVRIQTIEHSAVSTSAGFFREVEISDAHLVASEI